MTPIFSFKGTAGRKEILLATVALMAIAYVVNYLREIIYPFSESGIVHYALMKTFLAVTYLGLLQPLIARRLKDLKFSVWWSLLFWFLLPFNAVNLLAIQEFLGIQFDLANLPAGWDLFANTLYLLAICTVILSIMLFVVPSRHNKQLKDRPCGAGNSGEKSPSSP